MPSVEALGNAQGRPSGSPPREVQERLRHLRGRSVARAEQGDTAAIEVPHGPTVFQVVVDQFQRLADEWERETRNLSSPRAIMSHPVVDKIVSMGDIVIPLILGRMERRPWFWFQALKQLSNESIDPVKLSMRGDLQAMTDAWLQWGVRRGYIA
jgi:hypothetical protein